MKSWKSVTGEILLAQEEMEKKEDEEESFIVLNP